MGYKEIIKEATDCSDEVAGALEEIMREVIFHSTLDWQTREELSKAAIQALAVYNEMDDEEKEYYT